MNLGDISMYENNPVKQIKAILLANDWTFDDGNYYSKDGCKLTEEQAVRIFQACRIGEYDRGYNSALTHIMGVCAKELED